MYEKILSALKTKFQGVPGDVLDKRARKLSETVTEDDSIQTAVDGVKLEDLFKAYGDSRVTQATETAAKKAIDKFRKDHNLDENGKPIGTGGSGTGGNDDDPPKGDDDTPKWAKGLLTTVTELQTKLKGFEEKEVREQRTATIANKLKAAGIPEKLHKRFSVEDDADDNAIDTAVTEFKQELNDLGFSGLQEPGGNGEASEASAAELEGYLDDKFGSNEKK